jgi:PAS domain S-box-containing protein
VKESAPSPGSETDADRLLREDHHRLIAENTRDLICLLDQKGQLTYVSPSFEKVLGHHPESLLGKKIFSLLRPQDKQLIRKMLQETQSRGAGPTAEFHYKHKEGHWLVFESVINWVLNEKRKPVKAVVVSRDITERKRLEEQFRQSQKMDAIGRLAGGVAHDFNNLLTAISGYSDILYRSFDPMDPRRADAEEIKSTAQRAAALTQQLLAFSRRQIIQPTVVDMNAVVANLQKMLNRLIGEDIDLVTVLEPRLKPSRADVGQMEQVLLNLTVNSRDAMPEGGKLIIETSNAELTPDYAAGHDGVAPGRYVLLTVTDTGCGMDENTVNHLFEPFYTTKEQGRGTGLGLSTVYGIVQQSGGHIRVFSKSGKGTTFKIYIPQASAPTQAPDRVAESEDFFRGSETLLLVEDDPTVRRLAERVLRSSGYSLLVAASGAEALRLLKEGDPLDMLVTDVVMPGMSGPDLAKQLRLSRPELKVLFLSGYMEDDLRTRVLTDGSYAYIPKPFRPNDLTKKIRDVLDAPPGAAPSAA